MADLATWRVDPLMYFKRFDTNHDGKLSASELKPALQSIGFNPTDQDVKDLITKADTDGDGYIEYSDGEFMKLLDELEDDDDDKVLAAFRFLDKDGNGKISAAELRQLVMNHGSPMSEEEADRLISQADTNGDGEIDYNEFIEMGTQSTVLYTISE